MPWTAWEYVGRERANYGIQAEAQKGKTHEIHTLSGNTNEGQEEWQNKTRQKRTMTEQQQNATLSESGQAED